MLNSQEANWDNEKGANVQARSSLLAVVVLGALLVMVKRFPLEKRAKSRFWAMMQDPNGSMRPECPASEPDWSNVPGMFPLAKKQLAEAKNTPLARKQNLHLSSGLWAMQ